MLDEQGNSALSAFVRVHARRERKHRQNGTTGKEETEDARDHLRQFDASGDAIG
jgi:hypothetical protein